MEFKFDEATACRLALHVLGYGEPGVGHFFPTAGLTSSVGIPNPPLFVYLVAIPLAIVRSPLAVTVMIAAANVVAIWLVYLLGKRFLSPFVGAAAAALLTLSPWGIVFSRKIWAQDLLPLAATLFALQLHSLVVKRRPRAGFWLVVITALATQLHFSAWILAVVAAAALIQARTWVSWRWTGLGLLLAAASYAPFLALHAEQLTHIGHGSHGSHPTIAARFETCIRLMTDILGGGNLRFLVGQPSAIGGALSSVLAVAAVIGLVAAARRGPQANRQLGRLLLLWYVLPLALLTILPVRPYIHYFIVLLPVAYIGVAYLIELAAHRPTVRTVLVGAVLCSFLIVDVQLFRTVSRLGGAPGDYGVAYRYKADAVRFALEHANGTRVVLGLDPTFAQRGPVRTYRFLLWNTNPDRPSPPAHPVRRYLLLSRFASPPAVRARYTHARSYPTRDFGPLLVVAVP